jgi:hypothetical protein
MASFSPLERALRRALFIDGDLPANSAPQPEVPASYLAGRKHLPIVTLKRVSQILSAGTWSSRDQG